MIRWGSLLAAFSLLLAGCTSFHGLEPISPAVGNPNFPKLADSLQPTLRWKAAENEDVTYDLIVYKGLKTESFWEGPKRAVGPEVYYRKGLKETYHRIEKTLEPETEYYFRHGERVSKWALYDYSLFLVTAYVHAGNRLFIFLTPPK